MSDSKIIYFDNAATSYPKPEVVYQAQDSWFRNAGNPGRGAHCLALQSARQIFESRSNIAAFLGIKSSERLVFTPGCTYSINTVLQGFPFSKHRRGFFASSPPVVIVSPLEHNAVMRPLDRLQKAGVLKIHRLAYAASGVIDLNELKQAIYDLKPALCAIQEGSNVTGELIDIPAIWEICREAKVSLLVDAAQTAGVIESSLGKLLSYDDEGTKYDGAHLFWCASGHKGLMGPAGIGLLYTKNASALEPLLAGGTGSNSESLEMPVNCPDRFESGTLPVQSIAALSAGVSWLRQEGLQRVRDHEMHLTVQFLAWCASRPYMKVYGSHFVNSAQTEREWDLGVGLPVVSFAVQGLPSDRIADLLDREFNIAVRSGLHCAMAAHQSLGTLNTGLTRVSFSYFNIAEEVDELCRALSMIYEKMP